MKKIEIHTSVLSNLNKLGKELLSKQLNTGNSKQGFIFGFENENKIEVSLCFSLSMTGNWEDILNNLNVIKQYLKNTRLDYVPIGIFYVSDNSFMSKETIDYCLKFNSLNENSIIAFYNPSMEKVKIKKL